MGGKFITVGIAVAIGLIACVEPANAFGDHESITKEALSTRPGRSFLNEWVLDDINNEHAYMDQEFQDCRPWNPGCWDFNSNIAEDDRHFDDCEFDGSVKFINKKYRESKKALVDRSLDDFNDAVGQALHPVQDFYSHSNWVELGFPSSFERNYALQSDLVDLSGAQGSLVSSWFYPRAGESVRGDILLANDNFIIGRGWSIDKNGAGQFVSTLKNREGIVQGRLLESGRGTTDDGCEVQRFPEIFTDHYEGFRHSDLNKDDSGSTAESELKYQKARALAVRQTAYEWCRLVAAAEEVDRDGFLLTVAVRPSMSPHPRDTPCARVNEGEQSKNGYWVTVQIEGVKIKDAGDSGDDPGEVQIAAALYDDPNNFNNSVHVRNHGGPMTLGRGDRVPKEKFPLLQACLRPGEVNFAIHGWDNEEGMYEKYGTEFDDVGDSDELIVGSRLRFRSDSPPAGLQTSDAEDMQVQFTVSRQNTRCSL